MEPYVGMIIPAAFGFTMNGWASCNGQMLNVQDYPELFAVLGTKFGGDGKIQFALPDLRGRTPIGLMTTLGATGGVETVALTPDEMPMHSHPLSVMAARPSGRATPPAAGNLFSAPFNAAKSMFGAPSAIVPLVRNLDPEGGGQPHDNMQPSLVLNFLIALQGDFPSAA